MLFTEDLQTMNGLWIHQILLPIFNKNDFVHVLDRVLEKLIKLNLDIWDLDPWLDPSTFELKKQAHGCNAAVHLKAKCQGHLDDNQALLKSISGLCWMQTCNDLIVKTQKCFLMSL